jgi:hypothetical protein
LYKRKHKCNNLFYPSFQSNERLKSTGDGPTQRASALAALSNAFNPSLKPKTPLPSRSGQGSQRAAAVAALSSVLTAEQSGSSENLRAKASSTGDKTGRDGPSFSFYHSLKYIANCTFDWGGGGFLFSLNFKICILF